MTNSLSNETPSDTMIRGTAGTISWGMLAGGPDYGIRIQPGGKGKNPIVMPWKGQGDTGKLWLNLLDCVKTRKTPMSDIATAVRVQAPLSMGVVSHRENKVVRFDRKTQTIAPF